MRINEKTRRDLADYCEIGGWLALATSSLLDIVAPPLLVDNIIVRFGFALSLLLIVSIIAIDRIGIARRFLWLRRFRLPTLGIVLINCWGWFCICAFYNFWPMAFLFAVGGFFFLREILNPNLPDRKSEQEEGVGGNTLL